MLCIETFCDHADGTEAAKRDAWRDGGLRKEDRLFL